MKTLLIIRHAKSSWEFPVDDKDRALKLRGVTDAHLVANAIESKIAMPDQVYSSIANRAMHTCAIFMRSLQIPLHKLQLKDELYDFSGSTLTHLVKSTSNDINTLMLFGHNYAITSFVNVYGSKIIDNVPTSGAVMIQFDIDSWEQIDEGKTIFTVFPKDLK